MMRRFKGFSWGMILIGLGLGGSASFLSAAPPRSSELDTYLAQARQFSKIGNTFRARSLYFRGFHVDPSDPRPFVGMAELDLLEGKEADRRFHLVEAFRRGFRPSDESEESRLFSAWGLDDATSSSSVVVEIEARYFGVVEAFGPRGIGAVSAGKTLRDEALLVQGWDRSGRVVSFNPVFRLSSGLVLGRDPASETRFRVRALSRPSRGEWIEVVDPGSGTNVRIAIDVVGPPVSVELTAVRHRVEKGVIEVPPGETVLVHARILDGVGHLLYHPRLDWSLSDGAGKRTEILQESTTLRTESHFFEPHRNRLTVPAGRESVSERSVNSLGQGKEGIEEEFVIEAKLGNLEVAGRLVLRIDDSAGLAPWTATRVPFFAGSFEEAVEEARRRAKPLLVVAAAHW